MEPLPDLGTLSDVELKRLIEDLETQEREVSYQRRILHGKIDILRAELVARLQRSGTLARRLRGDWDDNPEGGSRVREPRRPIRPSLGEAATADPEIAGEP